MTTDLDEIDLSLSTTKEHRTSFSNLLHCPHLRPNNNLYKTTVDVPCPEVKYCYTCKGKIRKYQLKSPSAFIPNVHSTPNQKCPAEHELHTTEARNIYNENDKDDQELTNRRSSLKQIININEIDQPIPTISHQIEARLHPKQNSYTTRRNNQGRLRKSLKGIGCVVNFSVTETPIKKRTQIQACSITVMIAATVVISLILVNLTAPNKTHASKVASTIIVPTENITINMSSTISGKDIMFPKMTEWNFTQVETIKSIEVTTKAESTISKILLKIQKNIRTYPKNKVDGQKSKDINNRDLSHRFCSCQTNEVCMLDEANGTSVCRKALDMDDPTGCGGLCALETEACKLVDKDRGVRVCRLLSLVTCSPQEWRCRNGLCVAANSRCDGAIDCYDKTDEMYCECDLKKEFRCGHSISCFPNSRLCDGNIDCWDGYDEVNCTAECPEDQFTCTDGQCIISSRFCDGLPDCADSSDEPQGCDGACGAHELRCQNRRCVATVMRCDGQDHCGDGTDELNCT